MQIKIRQLKSRNPSPARIFARSNSGSLLSHDVLLLCCGLLLLTAFIISTGCNDIKTIPLEIGTEKVDITPPIGYPRYGYPPVKSTGVKDPLQAKALVFRQGEIQGALLVCDLLGIPRDLSRLVRERASKQTGIPFQNISISATHTHTSPRITQDFKEYALREASGRLTEEDKESYFTYLIDGMTEAVPPSVSGDPWRLPVEIHAFKLDHETAIVTMPGELFVEFAFDLKQRSPFSNTMLIELANTDIAYVPTKQAFREGDYEPINSRLAPGSGEKMIDEAVQILNDLYPR